MKRVLLVALLVLGILGGACTRSVPSTQVAPTSAPARGAAPAKAAWEQKWETTVDGARKEKTLVLYGEITPQQRDALLAFQSKYGIDMEFVIGKGNEIVARWTAENGAGINSVDVFHLSPGPGINLLKPKNALARIDQYFILPEVTDTKIWPQGQLPFVDAADKTMLMLNYSYTSYTAVNTDLIKEGQIKSLKDLLKPEFKEKIVFFDPAIFSASTAWVVYLVKDIYGLDAAKDYLRQFAANRPVVTRDAVQQLEWLARGKYPVAVGVSHAAVSDYKAKGLPVTIHRFSEGGGINPGSGLVEAPPAPAHPNATALYINWLLTAEGQAAFNKGFGSAPVRLGVTIEGIDPAKVPLPGEKLFVFDEDHFKFQPEAVNIAREVMGDLLR